MARPQRPYRSAIAELSPERRDALRRALETRSMTEAPRRPTLVAYWCASGGEAPSADDLRAFLTDRPMDHQLPQRFERLDALPRLPGGKLDRRALRPPAAPEPRSPFCPPRNETETTLARIWQEALGLDRISIFDDFFEVGGDSLISIRVLARARREGLTVRTEDFLDHPTIAAVAEHLETGPVGHEPASDQEDALRTDRAMATTSGSTAETLLRIWREILGVQVGLDQELIALGLTSLQAAQGFAQIERRLGRSLPLSTLFSAPTVRRLIEALEAPVGHTPSLVTIQPQGERRQLFVIGGECGEVLGMPRLARALGSEQPFYCLQSRGLDGREAPRTQVMDMGADFAAEIAPVARHPFVILGLAGGAAVALETARRLAADGHPAALLVAVNPLLPGNRFSAIERGVSFARERLSFHWNDLRRADTPQRVTRLVLEKAGRFARFGRGVPTVNGRPMSASARVQQANRNAFLAYRSHPYRGPVSILFTSEGRMARAATDRTAWWHRVVPSPPVGLVSGIDPFPESVLDVGADPLTSSNLAVVAKALRQQIDAV